MTQAAQDLTARAAALLAAGQAQAALRVASDACRVAPGDARAHYVYGEAWTAVGETARAERAYAAAIELDPALADAWVGYGVARYRQGHAGDAVTAMRRALAHAPGHAAAAANLGAFLRIGGDAEGAEAVLRAALSHDPANAAARLNLAASLLQQERAADARALLRDGPPAQADARLLRHWWLQQSLALLQLGAVAEARVVLARFDALGPVPPEVAPLRDWREVLAARAEGDMRRAVLAAEAMAASLAAMGPNAVPEHRIMGHYDLAKFWSGAGAPARAFAHWQAGHDLLRPLEPFSRAAHAAFIEANMAAFDAARLADGPRAADADPAPVFVVGMPRSGTTLCEQIIGAHPAAHPAGERPSLGEAYRALGGGADAAAAHRIAALDEATLTAAAARYLSALHALAPDRARVVDKMPGNYLYLGLAAVLLPGARFIHCVRDPRDIGLSIFTFRFYGHHAYAHDLADLGWAIAQEALEELRAAGVLDGWA